MSTIDELRKHSKKFEEALARAREKIAGADYSALEAGDGPNLDDVSEAVRAGDEFEMPGASSPMKDILEAIILQDLRPAYFIDDDKIIIDGDYDHVDLIKSNQAMLEGVSKNVGRVDLLNHSTMEYVGTGWMIDTNIVVTNRHVAELFSQQNWLGQWEFKPGTFGRPLRVELDFIKQRNHDPSLIRVARVTRILFLAPPGGPDIAFLEVQPDDDLIPIELQTGPIQSLQPVAAVGYPAWDGRRNDADLMNDIFGDVYGVKRFSPGLINGMTSDRNSILTDYSSLGGNSGSAVLDLETGKAVGLHYAGVFRDTNYAVSADIVAAALREIKSPVIAGGLELETPITEAPELTGRDGYDADFLGQGDLSVALPDIGARQEDLAPVSDDPDGVLKYTHFSVLQSISRRLPMLTAVNIDGAKAVSLKRKGRWRLDGRIDKDHQIGNELYRSNPLDRGHMVRRKDPGWGATDEIAQQAEIDTFHYTNSAPQHEDLNQRDWVGLESYILEAATTRDFKACVMTGPIFLDDDPTLRSQPGAEDVKIPRSFWKIAVMINDETGDLSATGYILTQGELIRNITEAAFVLGAYKTYQVSIAKIERETGFDWGNLRDHDPLNTAEEGVFGESVRLVSGPESLSL